MDNEVYSVRRVSLSDAEAINDIYNHYVLHTAVSFETEALSVGEMRQRIATLSAEFPYFVCEISGRVVGYCYVHLWKERAAYCHTYETTLYLHPDFVRHGLGSVLLNLLVSECRSRGYHALIACITANNAASIAFHAHHGFEQVSLFKQVGHKFGEWLDVVDMELVL